MLRTKPPRFVLANLLLEPEFQAAQILPENGFGLGYAIDVNRVSDTAAVAKFKTLRANWATPPRPPPTSPSRSSAIPPRISKSGRTGLAEIRVAAVD